MEKVIHAMEKVFHTVELPDFWAELGLGVPRRFLCASRVVCVEWIGGRRCVCLGLAYGRDSHVPAVMLRNHRGPVDPLYHSQAPSLAR
jgi:hypothetical protein